MWALGGTSQYVREGIADWFRNPTGPQGPGGASTSLIKLGGAMEIPRGDQRKKAPSDIDKKSMKIERGEENKKSGDKKGTKEGTKDSKAEQDKPQVSEAERKADKKRLDALLEKLKKAIERSQALKPFKDQLLLDITPEGLRIQIVDKENRPMFDLGSAVLKPYTRKILEEIADSISTVPNKISITGHTDATPFTSRYIYVEYGSMEERRAYSNWELSADRANAARRALLQGGLKERKIGRVVGLASSVLFDKANPFNPVNRRISIIVLNKATQAAIDAMSERQSASAKEAAKRLSPSK
jgi:chemotaxis protein MotB